MLCAQHFWKKHPLRIERPFWGGQSKKKWTKILEGARHIHKKYRMQKIWSKPVIWALWSAESNLQRHIEGSHRALYFQSRSQRNIEQQCTRWPPNLNVTQFLTQDSNLNQDLSETDVKLQLVSKISSPLFWAHSLGFPKQLFWFLLLAIKHCSFRHQPPSWGFLQNRTLL